MNVYNTKVKRVVDSIDLSEVKKTLKSWVDCKKYLLSLKIESNKKLINWYSYLLWKKVQRKEKTTFFYYLKKVLQKKPLHNTVLKGVILNDN